MSSSSPVPDVQYVATSPSPRGKALPWIVGFALLVLVPAAIIGFPSEMSSWKLAAAMEAWDRGDSSAAEHFANAALAWNPHNDRVHLARAQQLVDAKEYAAALEKLDRLKMLQGTPAVANMRTMLLAKMGRFEEAVAQLDPVIAESREAAQPTIWIFEWQEAQSRLLQALNHQAYLRAVGNRDLPAARKQIDEVLEMTRNAGLNAGLLDTRGYIRWRMGEFTEAAEDLDLSLKESEAILKILRGPQSPLGRNLVTATEYDRRLRAYAETTAVILYHRGLVYQAQDNTEQAEKAFARVRELGFEPNEKLF